MNYEAVIGLEVHVQIKTQSKMFTRVAAGYGFEPNTLTDPVVLALPGVLPVMNKAALDVYTTLRRAGTQESVLDIMQTRSMFGTASRPATSR